MYKYGNGYKYTRILLAQEFFRSLITPCIFTGRFSIFFSSCLKFEYSGVPRLHHVERLASNLPPRNASELTTRPRSPHFILIVRLPAHFRVHACTWICRHTTSTTWSKCVVVIYRHLCCLLDLFVHSRFVGVLTFSLSHTKVSLDLMEWEFTLPLFKLLWHFRCKTTLFVSRVNCPCDLIWFNIWYNKWMRNCADVINL